MKYWGKGMVVIMPKLDHGDKMFIMGQLKALYKTMLVLQKEIKKLETRRAKDKEKRVKEPDAQQLRIPVRGWVPKAAPND